MKQKNEQSYYLWHSAHLDWDFGAHQGQKNVPAFTPCFSAVTQIWDDKQTKMLSIIKYEPTEPDDLFSVHV